MLEKSFQYREKILYQDNLIQAQDQFQITKTFRSKIKIRLYIFLKINDSDTTIRKSDRMHA